MQIEVIAMNFPVLHTNIAYDMNVKYTQNNVCTTQRYIIYVYKTSY